MHALCLALNDRNYHYHPINSKMGYPTGTTTVLLIARQTEAKMIKQPGKRQTVHAGRMRNFRLPPRSR